MARRLVSPFIVDRLGAGDDDGSIEAATLFADVAGFSALTSSLAAHGQFGSEIVARLMTTLFTPLVDAVYAHGGAITGFAGDSFTALFPSDGSASGVPGAARALAAATEMRQHLTERDHLDTPWGAFEIGVKIGLAVGAVQWRILHQDDGSASYFVRGSAIDDCATIDAHAAPGDLVLHPSARVHLRDVTVEEIPDSTPDGAQDGFARVLSVGAALPQRQSVRLPPGDVETLARFLPSEVIEQTEVGEFRHVVNVFISLQGSPDDDELRSVVQVIRDLQANNGGVLNRIAFGDKGCNLLLFWGAPVSFENDVERALRFSLDLQLAVTRPLRIGVTAGVSYAGLVGSELHAEFTVYGEGINLAARLMTSAPWGSIWIDAAAHRSAATTFVTSSVGRRTFKGFAEPHEVFDVTEARVSIERRFAGDTVGRDAESAALAAFVAPVLDGRFAGMIVVQGDAGLGKSRLVNDVLRGFEPTTLRAVVAPADAIERRPFNPFRHWLRTRFGRDPRVPDQENKATFDERFDALLTAVPDPELRRELDRVRSLVGALVDLHWEGSLASQLDPRTRYEHTIDAITSLVFAESLCQPLVLVIEDVHWIDDGSADVVRRLITQATSPDGQGSIPVAVIATARHVDDTTFGAPVEHQNLVLAPLAHGEIMALATLVLGAPPSSRLADLLTSRTGGNPFFTEQLLYHLRDERLVTLTDGEWTVDRATSSDAALPTDITVILMAQLDRLGQSAREVAQAASVLGREFSHHELMGLLEEGGVEPAEAGSALDAGRAARIWAPIDPSRWAFRHVLLRDAAYDMQLHVRRAVMHRRAGTMLERIWSDDLEPHYLDISRHHEAACLLGVDESRRPAVDYLAKAGAQATNSFASATAADLFTRALALTPVDDLRGRFDLLLEREWANDGQGERVAQAVDVDALESLALQIGEPALQAEASMRRAYLTGDTSDFTGALAASDRTISLARAAGLIDLESTALRTGGAALRAMGRFDEALERFEHALAVARAAGLEYQEATATTAWSALIARRGRWRDAASGLEWVADTFERSGRVVRRAHALSDWGLALIAGGQLGAAGLRLEQSLALAEEAGDESGQIPPLCGLAQILTARGDFRGADALAARGEALAAKLDAAHLLARSRVIRGRAAVLSGDRAAAHRFLTTAQQPDDEFNDLESSILTHLAALALLEGRPGDAVGLAAEAVDLARAVDDRVDCVVAVLYRSLADEALGNTAEAEAGFQEVIEIEQTMDASPGRTWDARAGLARLAQQQGRPDVAFGHAEPLIDRLLTHGGADDPSHGLGLCEQPMRVHLTVAQLLGATGDSRADSLVAHAGRILAGWLDGLDDPASRQQLLDIEHHREVVALSSRRG